MANLELWLGGLATLAVISFVFKENPVYRFVEYAYVGAGSAHLVVLTWHDFLKPTIADQIMKEGKYWLILPVLLGLLVYARYIPSLAHLTRIPVALWVGMGSGYILAYRPSAMIGQITSSFIALNSISNIIFAVLLLTSLLFFVFTVTPKHKAWSLYSPLASVGRIGIMVGLGAAFGNTVMARMSLLLGRIQFILIDWLKIAQ